MLKTMMRSGISVLFVAFLISLSGCSRSTEPVPSISDGTAPIALRLTMAEGRDDRTYSVGRVQIRGVRQDGSQIVPQIFEVDRATGVIDLEVRMLVGDDYTMLVEPLGSAILPNGGKTNSGIALQAVMGPFDVEADSELEMNAVLEPFIPDGLFIASHGNDLSWTPMSIATGHRVKVLERAVGSDDLSDRIVDFPDLTQGVIDLFLLDNGVPIVGYQVQSTNQFGESAFSDTLFWSRP